MNLFKILIIFYILKNIFRYLSSSIKKNRDKYNLISIVCMGNCILVKVLINKTCFHCQIFKD